MSTKISRSLRAGLAPLAKTLLLGTGALKALRTVRPSHAVAILRYHAICGPEGHRYASPGICISPEAFHTHVKYLASNYAVVSLADAVAALREGRVIPANALAITFDDGYADNLSAARVLHRHGLTATFYVTAGCIDDAQPFWPAELRGLLANIAGGVSLRVNGSRLELPLGSEQDHAAALSRLTRLLKSHALAERDAIREQLRAAARYPRLPRVMLTREELAEVRDLGMTIGAHTITHPNLPSLSIEDAREEIVGSKRRLENELGTQVTMFSYPNGGAERYFTPELQQIVRDAGFEAATTSKNGFADRTSDLFALERVQVAERLEDLVFALEVDRVASPRPQKVSSIS